MDTEVALRIAVGVVLGYLLGSMPWAIIIGRLFFGTDVREHGSGNAGATNVYRTLGWKAALPVAILDISKGTLATLMPLWLLGPGTDLEVMNLAQVLSGMAAVLGHTFSPYLKFRGGKGVATLAGMLLVLTPLSLLPAAIIWVVVIAIWKYVSLGSIVAAASYPIIQAFMIPRSPVLIGFACIAAALVIWLHRKNIQALRTGTERRFSFSRAKQPEDPEV